VRPARVHPHRPGPTRRRIPGRRCRVQKLALRTRDRYKAALDRFTDFCAAGGVKSADAVSLTTVEDFVVWLRGRRRARNGAPNGSKSSYKIGIKFVLGTCRTAFNSRAVGGCSRRTTKTRSGCTRSTS
jgi:hypothetical protein